MDFQLTGGRRNASIEHYDLLVAQIAHELQHAAEIAADVMVVDADTLAGRYERIGGRRPTPRGVAYETESALEVGRVVLQELRANRRRRRAAGETAGGAVSGTADQR